jgi:hypothetical protein
MMVALEAGFEPAGLLSQSRALIGPIPIEQDISSPSETIVCFDNTFLSLP